MGAFRDGALEYEVQDILDSRGRGVEREYLVHWKGQSKEQATWEPLQNLSNCRNKLRAFARTRRRQLRVQASTRDEAQLAGGEQGALFIDSSEAAMSQGPSCDMQGDSQEQQHCE